MKTTPKTLLKVALVLVAIAVVTPVFYYIFFLGLARVPTGAMANTIVPGDHVVIKKRAFGEIKRGDVIVFELPKNRSEKRIGRVIGLPGERIQLRGHSVFVNDTELPEERVSVATDFDSEPLHEIQTQGTGPYRVFYSNLEGPAAEILGSDGGSFGINEPFRIPSGEYYIMGDNRDNSEDSRYWGTVNRSLIVGKATMIYWSIGRPDSSGRENIRWDRIFQRINK